MAIIKPFVCVRPSADKVDKIAALPYDVYNREEAKEVVTKNPQSFLAIDRAETQFSDDADMYAPEVYQKANSLLQDWISNGAFIRDENKCYYIYELTMNGRSQTGIVACASIDDYVNEVIKKHENTRADKEQDRINHVDTCSAQTGPIFLAYRSNAIINDVIAEVKKGNPLYDFVSEDGIGHRVFKIDSANQIQTIEEAFAAIQEIYIADGHHRAASAVKVGLKRRSANPGYTNEEEFNYFLSVLFPDEELMIMDYNRVVKDLNSLTVEEFLKKMKERFIVEEFMGIGGVQSSLTDVIEGAPFMDEDEIRPHEKGFFSMFIDEKWYSCKIREEDKSDDPVEGLDVSILQNLVLEPILGITDPKTDKRIDFIGGIRGLKEIEDRCEKDCKVGFAMYPTSIQELFAVADANRLMPPKSTWFEPKLRSGLFIHEIER